MLTSMSPESQTRAKDRIFRLEVIDGKKPNNSMGLVDPRLFKEGEDANRLRLTYEGETGLWSFKYDKGAVPQALSSRFTGVRQARDFAKGYFENRNIKIIEV